MKLDEATHLVLGDYSAEALRKAGATSVIVLRDLLSVGRCALDPAEHRAARIAQWKIDDAQAIDGALGVDDLARALAHVTGQIVLWTSPTWPSRLYEWWTIDTLVALDLARSRVTRTQIDRFFPQAAIPAAFATRTAIDELRIDGAHELWEAYVQPTPLAFDALRLRGSDVYPDLRETCEGFGAWFPRLEDGVRRASFGDERLLTGDVELLYGWFGDSACKERRDALCSDDFAPIDVGGFRINDPASPWVREPYEDGWRVTSV